MRNLFFDTNFLVDYLIRAEFRDEAVKLITTANTHQYRFFISYLSAANFAYIIRKSSIENRNFYLNKIKDIFVFIENNYDQFSKAMEMNAKDFEDALQYQAPIDSGCDCIITRNGKDFSFSEIPVLTPSDFLEKYLS